MPKFRLTNDTWVYAKGDGLKRRLHRAGEVVDIDDPPGPTMIPLDAEAEVAMAAAAQRSWSRRRFASRMREAE